MEKTETARSTDLKYFVRLAGIGDAYCHFRRLATHEISAPFVAGSAAPPWAIHEGKMTSKRV
jgi:hypothetical protein